MICPFHSIVLHVAISYTGFSIVLNMNVLASGCAAFGRTSSVLRLVGFMASPRDARLVFITSAAMGSATPERAPRGRAPSPSRSLSRRHRLYLARTLVLVPALQGAQP